MKVTDKWDNWMDFIRTNKYKVKEYIIKDGKKHPIAIICPGGAYQMVCSAGEGKPFASIEQNITEEYPDTFVWCGDADNTVDHRNSQMLASALEEKGVK